MVNFVYTLFMAYQGVTLIDTDKLSTEIAVNHEEQSIELIHQQVGKEAEVGPFPEAGSTAGENANNNDHTELTIGASVEVCTLVDDTNPMQNDLASSDVDQAMEHHELECVNTESSELDYVGNVEAGFQQSPSGMTTSSIHEKDGVNDSTVIVPYEWKDFDFPEPHDLADSPLEGESSIVQLDPPFPEHAPEAVPSKQDDSLSDMTDMKESTTNSICNIDVLEDSIEDAKHNKVLI